MNGYSFTNVYFEFCNSNGFEKCEMLKKLQGPMVKDVNLTHISIRKQTNKKAAELCKQFTVILISP